MKVLLDTCTILWSVSSPDQLSPKAKKIMLDEGSDIYVSPMSCAEIACAVERKKIELDQHWKLWFRKFIDLNGWKLILIDLPIIEEAYSLPGELHRDPVDRILISTSRLYKTLLLTADKKILNYPHVDSEW